MHFTQGTIHDMRDILHRSWAFILVRLSTSNLSLVLFSVLIPVLVFVATSIYTWRASGGKVSLSQTLAAAVLPTLFGICVTVVLLLCLLAWGLVATIRGDYVSSRKTISDRDAEIIRLQAELEKLVAIKVQQDKLIIHSATYGTGEMNDVSVLNVVRNMTRDALVVPVDNNLVNGDDPAPMQPKRLLIEYSYGNSAKRSLERPESKLGAPSRLVLPEDSEIVRLNNELKIVKDAATSATETQRQLQVALAESERKNQQVKHSKSLDWGGEWKLAEDGFRFHYKSPVSAQRQMERQFETQALTVMWTFSNGDRYATSDIEAACARAGVLLISCPGFDEVITEEIRAIENDWQRWLEYLKDKHFLSDVDTQTCVGDNDKTVGWIQVGRLSNVAALSASECVKCAATALRFKQRW
jgi:hypothetical protein